MTTPPEEALEQAALAGVHRLAIPTPFAVGKVNAYLIEDDPLTLVDCGPNLGTSLESLTELLGARGHAIEDIELVLITHNHVDHIGLTEIVIHDPRAAASERLANFEVEAERDDEFAVDLMLRSGIPEEIAIALQSVSSSFRAW